MTTMISEVYAAFLAAGVPDDVARKAAEALSSESLATKADISKLEVKLDKELSLLKTDLAVLKWMTGLVMAGVAAQIVKSFFL